MNKREKSILTGLYLSKFSKNAISELGFKSYQEAFNVLGFSLGTKPSSIKNYRDEFDPLLPNHRKGWHKRTIRGYCKELYDDFKALNFIDFSELIKSFYIENYEIEKIIKNETKRDYAESVAKRLATGRAAEEYFKIEYKNIEEFSLFNITDTTQLACGFDYKLSNVTDFYCIEVKGLNEKKGSVQLTEKEFNVAKNLKSKYCLFLVTNFKEKPVYNFIFDPLHSSLKFNKIERKVTQISYNTTI